MISKETLALGRLLAKEGNTLRAIDEIEAISQLPEEGWELRVRLDGRGSYVERGHVWDMIAAAPSRRRGPNGPIDSVRLVGPDGKEACLTLAVYAFGADRDVRRALISPPGYAFPVFGGRFERVGGHPAPSRDELRALLPPLVGANLGGANLADAQMAGAQMAGSDFADANLAGANLEAADMSVSRLLRANLRGANLRGANLGGAQMVGADLREADLAGADLTAACLDRAVMPAGWEAVVAYRPDGSRGGV